MNSAHQIRTTGQKIIKIHQLEQILGKCPYAGSLCPPHWTKTAHQVVSSKSARLVTAFVSGRFTSTSTTTRSIKVVE